MLEATPSMRPESGAPAPALVVALGRMDYAAAWELQLQLARDRRAGLVPDLLLFVEHPHTYTLGRTGHDEHLLIGAEELARSGARLYHVDRGGDITYHGPGQLVGYPIVDLLSRGRDVHRYLRLLEEAVILTLTHLGLAGTRRPPHTGVWVGEEKIAAIGVKVSHGVTLHGFALNIAPDLGYFDRIVPCGIRDKGVTSLQRLLGRPVVMEAPAGRVAIHLSDLLGLRPEPLDLRGQPPAAVHDLIVAAGLAALAAEPGRVRAEAASLRRA